jgi:transposase
MFFAILFFGLFHHPAGQIKGTFMATFSMDLRARILDAYDAREGTRREIAQRFCVSLGMVKKLLQQRRNTGDIAPRHKFAGRKPKITAAHRERLHGLVRQNPDLTLEELRDALGMDCSVPAIYYVLESMGLSLKKRRSIPRNKIEPMSESNAKHGRTM